LPDVLTHKALGADDERGDDERGKKRRQMSESDVFEYEVQFEKMFTSPSNMNK
jgi:hypothetical protein